MSRMMSATAIVLLMAMGAILAFAPGAHADVVNNLTTIPLGYSTYSLDGQMEAHLLYVEISDDRRASTQVTTPLERVKFFRLFYQYENHGTAAADGDLKLLFIDDKGNEIKLDDGTYTGDHVSPGAIGTKKFVEIPLSRDSNIATIRVYKGFEYTDFPVPLPDTVTGIPTVAPTSAPSATATAKPTATPAATGTGNCLPLLPFAILATVGLVGVVARKQGKK